MRTIRARHAFDAHRELTNVAVTLADGVISRIEAADRCDDAVLLPALTNAHDHARPLRTSSIGGFSRPLEVWLQRLALFAPVDPYLAAAAAFGRAARGGQGAIMVHYVRAMGLTDYPTEAGAVAKAAADVGVRIAFGVGMRDQNPLVYGDANAFLHALDAPVRAELEQRFLAAAQPIKDQIALVDSVAERIGGPMVDVQYAPNGPQWCSPAFWEAIAEASARTGRRVTTHLFETKYQREWADRNFPEGLVRWWKDIGLLSPRLTLAHCVWARPDELDMIAQAGCIIASNPSSNLALRSGIAPVADMVKRGCRVALGIDGQAFDEDDDALRELRLLWSLHGGWGFDVDVAPRRALEMALETGRTAVTGTPGGRLETTMAADLLLVDRAALNDDDVLDVSPLDLLFARGTKRLLREVIVAGRTIVRDGHVLGIDLDSIHDELRARMRAGIAARGGLLNALPHYEAAARRHYLRLGCC